MEIPARNARRAGYRKRTDHPVSLRRLINPKGMTMRLTYSTSSILKLIVFVLAALTVANGFNQTDVLILANTKVSLQLLSPISTAASKKGDKFSCKVLTPIEFAGAVVEGHVRSVKRSGKADKESKIDLAFDRVTLADGRTATFS